MHQTRFIFFFLLATVVISSLISTPILAAFTLPLYFLAYPRPMKFWPQGMRSQNSTTVTSGDAIYYEQLVPPLLKSVHRSIRAGRLGLQQPGNIAYQILHIVLPRS